LAGEKAFVAAGLTEKAKVLAQVIDAQPARKAERQPDPPV
jgi:hypothetical protein